MPVDCMKAYMMVGPTKVIPRFLRSLLRAVEMGVSAWTSFIDGHSGWSGYPYTNFQR